MSLEFKKKDYSMQGGTHAAPHVPQSKGSALSLLLERSKGSRETSAEPKQENVDDNPNTSNPPSPTQSLSYSQQNHLDHHSRTSAEESASSVRIPSSSWRNRAPVTSSLQQQRQRARTGDSSIQGTPTSSVLGSSAGCGFVFGAGEIGNVSSPRHYSTTMVRDKIDPSSVDERFVVNLPRTPSVSGAASYSDRSASGLNRSLSKISLSRSSSRSSMTSLTSLRRFVEKPWKDDAPGSPGSGIGQSPPGSVSHNSRKNSIASIASSILGEDDYSKPSTPSASVTALDQAYASNHSLNGNYQRRKQSLSKAYGKLGKTLGEGAGGHVKIIRSNVDSQVYAVKEFRTRHTSETVREYNKKVGAEFCLGLTLKHPNIVNTVDIIYEPDKVYQVMEYCAYDLFAIVMSGKMTRDEVFCDFRQLMDGIRYLHNSGIAHRDLKLDNCVVTEQGIVKIIDFGSSVVYRYPESDKIYDCDGVVGSDPYLAPEAAGQSRYNPTGTDIWSAAIVLRCMLMRKFPWKAPRLSDPAFKAFIHEEPDGSRPGLAKLMLNLPPEVIPLLTGMMDLDPEERWSITRCWEDPWLNSAPYCTMNDHQVIHAPGHTHTSVSFEEAHIAMLEKKNRKAKRGEKMW